MNTKLVPLFQRKRTGIQVQGVQVPVNDRETIMKLAVSLKQCVKKEKLMYCLKINGCTREITPASKYGRSKSNTIPRHA